VGGRGKGGKRPSWPVNQKKKILYSYLLHTQTKVQATVNQQLTSHEYFILIIEYLSNKILFFSLEKLSWILL